MIGRLSGTVVLRAADHVVIDVRGVGYVVHVPDRVLAGLPGPGEAVTLWTDLLVREDLLQLLGFATLAEKEWHRLLIGVAGVGAKASLAILGTLGAEGLARAVALGDWAAVARAKGVGPKIAQRVVLDLKGKAPAVMALGAGPEGAVIADDPPAAPAARRAPAARGGAARTGEARAQAQAEALSALANLGYAPSEAAAAVAEAAGGAPADAALATPALIRAALRLLAPRG